MGLDEKIHQRCINNQFMKHNHIQLKEWAPDLAVTELVVREEALNPHGFLQGGAYYTMADIAGGIAAFTSGQLYVTLGSSFNFLHSASLGELVRAEAKVRRRGRTTCYVDVDVVNGEGVLLASGHFTYYCVG